jgi:hypothetical protein
MLHGIYNIKLSDKYLYNWTVPTTWHVSKCEKWLSNIPVVGKCPNKNRSQLSVLLSDYWWAGQLSRYSDLLWAGRSGDRIPVEARFSAPVQTGPGAQPASRTMDTGSFPGVKRPGRGIDRQPPSSAEVKERVELYLYSPSVPSWHAGQTLLLLSHYIST